jgi:glycosyltransferase involved in cell wall biosynthesis
MPEPKISIIIPVKNAERTMGKMFEYLMAVDYPHAKIEIIIADGGSKDKTIEIIREWQGRYPFIKLVEVKDSKSPGQARNVALKEVTGEYILFTDADCAPEPGWIKELLKPFFMDPQIGGVGGEVLTLKVEKDNLVESYCEQTFFLSPRGRGGIYKSGYMPALIANYPSEVDGSHRCPFFATANVAFPKKVFDKEGGEFWHQPTGEDVDFCLRVLADGYKLYYAKESVVKHMHRVNLKNFTNQWYHYGYGHPLLIAKHAAKIFEVVVVLGPYEFSIPIPWHNPGLINIGAFHLMHLFGAATLLSLLLQIIINTKLLTLILGLIFLATLIRYFYPCLKIKPLRHFFTFCKIRYLTNLSFVRGAMDGTKEFGPICIEPSW